MAILWGARGQEGKALVYPLLEVGVSQCSGEDTPPKMARTPQGKPYFPQRPDLCFNVSHSGSFALCGVGGSPLGVDVELVRPRREHLPQYALSGEEYRWFVARGGMWEDFYTLWVLKESYVKYLGCGLDVAPRDIAVPLLEVGEEATVGAVAFRVYGEDGWRGAICTSGKEPLPEDIIWRDVATI